MRSAIVLAAVLTATAAFAQDSGDGVQGIPAPGATVTLKPTGSGYEASIVIPRGKYRTAKVSSTDPMIARLLTQRADSEEEPEKPPPDIQEPPAAAAPGTQLKQPPAQSPQRQSFVKLVTIGLSSGAVRQGQFPLTLQLGGTAPVTRDMALVVPASRLDPLDTLVILRQLGDGGDTASEPQLWETSQQGWLTNITLAQKGDTDAGADPAGRVVPNQAKLADVPPGKNGRIVLGRDYQLEGSFPLGTAKGKLVVKADQLAEPVSFNFEVRSRIYVAWLFVPMAIGLGLGFASRTWLAGRLAASQQRKTTYALVSVINDAIGRNADQTFQAAAMLARDRALAAAKLQEASEVKTGTDAAQAVFQAALDDLKARRTVLDQKIAPFSAVVHADYRLPGALATELATTRVELDHVIAGLDLDNNIARADGALQAAQARVRQATFDVTRPWLEGARELGGIIQSLMTWIGLAAANDPTTMLKPILDAVSAPLTAFEADATRNIERLKAVLDGLHGGIYALEDLLGFLVKQVGYQIGQFERQLGSEPLPKPASWQAWLAAANEFATALHGVNVMDPGATTPRLAELAAQLPGQLREALLDQVATDEQHDQLEALFSAGKHGEAVAKLAELLAQAAREKDGRLLGRLQLGPDDVPAAAEPAPTLGQITLVSPSVVYGYPQSARDDGSIVSALAAMTNREIESTGWLLSIIYAAIIAGAGYFLFADKWIGTPIDFATVFFWAYVTDIGADAATTAAKGVKAP